MFAPTPEQIAILEKLDSTYRFTNQAPTWKEMPDGKLHMFSQGCTICFIIDLRMDEVYASGMGDSKATALADALNKAIPAPKPLTPAQKATKQVADTSKLVIGEKDQQIIKLMAKLEATQKRLAEVEKSAGRGRVAAAALPGDAGGAE
jgi:hypothetical protein